MAKLAANGFTLIEFLVVIAIIGVVIAFAGLGLPAMIESASISQAKRAIENAAITASGLSEMYCTPVAVRFEPKPVIDKAGRLVIGSNGVPRYESGQEMTFAAFGLVQDSADRKVAISSTLLAQSRNTLMDEAVTFRKLPRSGLHLPDRFWACPELETDGYVQPKNAFAAKVNPFETFYIVFFRGDIWTCGDWQWLIYMDERHLSGGIPVAVDHPVTAPPGTSQAKYFGRNILVYDRQLYKEQPAQAMERAVRMQPTRNGVQTMATLR